MMMYSDRTRQQADGASGKILSGCETVRTNFGIGFPENR